jgi:regulator of sigma E protease
MSWILAFIGFAVLIILHELGHFAAAKAVGMRVERFALFFPPLLARVRRGETEYAIGAIPLGGYVKITGMSPAEEVPPEHAHRAYVRQAVWKRVFVIAAGPAVNLVLAFLIFWGVYAIQGVPSGEVNVDQVERGSPAAGQLRPGDLLLSVDGRPGYAAGLTVDEVDERRQGLTRAVNAVRCPGEQVDGCRAQRPVQVTVLRDGQRRQLEIVPRYDAEVRRMRLGFAFGTRTRETGVVEAADLSVTTMWNVTTLTVDRIVSLFWSAEARDEVSGVVGSYEATRQTIELDAVRALQILGLISLSLGIINLFPFLPLDGGHIFWAVAEKLRGRPISLRVMERASIIGVMLVVLLFFIGLQNDIGRIASGEGFGVR